ncbi:LysR substrate-binding domain-containing protein [Streptomyces sp. NPDC005728]|uniref:LysR substrate-binding domain-containing protein n=1 Tax=Streptomyces sp. NPDC005728 TaxID=3157054 RepID=UPI0033CC904E
MEIRQLRSFLEVAQERHFGRAAERLHIAQPALSQQIKQLERQVGLSLFTRTSRRVELTEAGLRFLEHARDLLEAVERVTDEMGLLAQGKAGRVAMGFVGTATYDVLPRVAREVSRELPDVELVLRGELLTPQLVDGLVDRTYDLAMLRPEGLRTPGLLVHTVRTEKLVAVLPADHPLAHRRRIELAALAEETFVIHPSASRSSMHAKVLEACAHAGFTPKKCLEVGETATLVVFVSAGLGVALVPEPVRSLNLDGVAYVALAAPTTIDLAMARRAEVSPAVKRVAELVTRCIEKNAPTDSRG